jgi:hypothetical protein
MKLLDWFFGNWKLIAFAILIGLVVAYVTILQLRILNLKLDNAEQKVEVLEAKHFAEILGLRIGEQNKSIKLLEAKTKDAQKRRVAADKKAAPIVRAAQEKENAVASAPASNGTCESELNAIRGMLEAKQ